MLDTQQFWNWFWLVFAGIIVAWMNSFFYSLGWHRGRDAYKKVVHLNAYRGSGYGPPRPTPPCGLDHKKLIDELLEKNAYGCHDCPRCGQWLITFGAHMSSTPGGLDVNR